MSLELFKDILPSINLKTPNNLIDQNETLEDEYIPFMTNKALSQSIDCLFYVNELNKNHHLDKKLQYDFYFYAIPAKKRFDKWVKQEKIADVEFIQRYFGYNYSKAIQALRCLTQEQIDLIKEKLDK